GGAGRGAPRGVAPGCAPRGGAVAAGGRGAPGPGARRAAGRGGGAGRPGPPRHSDERRTDAGEKGAPRRVPREVPRDALDEPVEPGLPPLPASGVDHDPAPPARYSWTEATPRSCASKRLSRCSRVLTSPFPRTIPSPSTS